MMRLKAVVGIVLVAQTLACGTIMHPERKGQQSGRLDAGIVVLDAIGLLFFILPGVIAFAVDFSNGTIYLPPGKSGSKLEELRFGTGPGAKETVERIVRARTGLDLRLDQPGLRTRRLESREQLLVCFAEAR